MLSMSEWVAQGADGVFTTKINKGKGRVKTYSVQFTHGELGSFWSLRMFDYGSSLPITYDSGLDLSSLISRYGLSLEKRGTIHGRVHPTP